MIIRNIIIQIFILMTMLFSIHDTTSNSNDIDSDGDGYTDRQEIQAGTDPKDEYSLIYQGYWPYNSNKEVILDPGFGKCPQANGCECSSSSSCPENSECSQLNRGKYCIPKVGSRVPRFIGVDQFGDQFDLYDLANQGKPILIEIGTTWPQTCKDFSAWRSYVNENALNQGWWKDKFTGIRDYIDNSNIYWVHIIHLDDDRNPATFDTIDDWYLKYPHDNIIYLADPDAKMKTWVRPTAYPCLIFVDENMNLQVHTLRGVEDAIDAVYDRLESE